MLSGEAFNECFPIDYPRDTYALNNRFIVFVNAKARIAFDWKFESFITIKMGYIFDIDYTTLDITLTETAN